MPRNADSPCAGCGKLVWRGKGKRAVLGSTTCWECRGWGSEHGTRHGYSKGCRCQLCRDAKAADTRKYAAAYKAKHGRSLYGNYRKPTNSRHGNAVPRALRLAVYERDGWVCQLCFDPVDPALDPNHRMAATLDHVECQTWALLPDHSAGNLRLAHRACNSRRREGRHG